uniref:Uncharacterized protein n=1 Tax=Oryza nivara TaxID=4536 RepID=A0A0E0J386_ORYNI
MGLSSVGLVVQPVVAQHSTHRQLPASAIVLPSFLRGSAARFSPVSALGPLPPGSRCATRRAARISVVRERGETTEKALQWRRVFMLHLRIATGGCRLAGARGYQIRPWVARMNVCTWFVDFASCCCEFLSASQSIYGDNVSARLQPNYKYTGN